jgi:hypothetical protein
VALYEALFGKDAPFKVFGEDVADTIASGEIDKWIRGCLQ